MEHCVISITRQFGSLGRLIAKNVAEKMGFNYFDRDIIEKAAESMNKSVYELNEYEGHKYSKYGRMMFPLGYGQNSKKEKLFKVEKDIILDFASKEDCVIVGRCSDYILKEANYKNLYSVFIYAPYDARFDFCLNTLGLTDEAAEVYMEKVDEARENFYFRITGEPFSSTTYRNLMIDSSAMSLDDTVDVICNAAKKKFGK